MSPSVVDEPHLFRSSPLPDHSVESPTAPSLCNPERWEVSFIRMRRVRCSGWYSSAESEQLVIKKRLRKFGSSPRAWQRMPRSGPRWADIKTVPPSRASRAAISKTRPALCCSDRKFSPPVGFPTRPPCSQASQSSGKRSLIS